MSRYILEVNSDIAKSIVVFGMVGERGISTVFKIDELEQLTADYINEHFSDLQDTAYQRRQRTEVSEKEPAKGRDETWLTF